MHSSPTYHHPHQPIRHSYPLTISDAGPATALNLFMRTLPFALARFGVLLLSTLLSIVWFVIAFGGGAWLSSRVAGIVGFGWILGWCFVFGSIWHFFVRSALYLLKCAHIAVLTELMTTGSVSSGAEGMFAHGRRVVTERFGQAATLFAVDAVVSSVVGAFNRTLGWVASILPVPGLDSVVGFINAVVRAATTYIDETIFSYAIARGDDNLWRNAKDGIIYYCQNSREILKTSVGIVVMDKVATVLLWVVCVVPGYVLALVLPGHFSPVFAAFFFGAIFASCVRGAFLRPFFLTMIMAKFHLAIRQQPIDPAWDGHLTQVSTKFQEIQGNISSWATPRTAPRPTTA